MKKFIFNPIWKIDKTEEKLSMLEENGYRLINVKFNYWFYFKKSKKRNASYFCSFSDGRGLSMINWETSISSNCSAQQIDTKFTSLNYFRVTKDNSKDDLLFLKETREDFMKSKLKELIYILVFLSSLFTSLCISINLLIFKIIFAIISAITILITLFNVYGFIVQCKKCKIINKRIKTMKQIQENDSSRQSGNSSVNDQSL